MGRALKRNTSDSNKDIVKQLIRLSIPTMIEEILVTVLQYVDVAMVGHLGEAATAAVSTTTTIGWLIGGVIHAFGIAILALMSRSIGEKNGERVEKLSRQAVLLVVVCAVIFGTASLILSPFIPVWMGADERIRAEASEYFFIISLPMLFRAAELIFASSIRATLDTRRPMIVGLLSGLLNVPLDYLFIYVFGWGVRGAAYATAICYVVGGSLMFLIFIGKEEFNFSFGFPSPDRNLLPEIGKIAVPAMATHATSCLGYVVFAGLVSGMGTTIFAAHSIAVNAETIVYIPGYGISSATSAMIGISLGEKNERKFRTVSRSSVFMTLGIMCINGVLLYLFAFPIMSVFSNSGNVVELGGQMLRMVAFSEPFFGLMICMQGIFYGMGRTKNVFYVEAFSMWCVRVLFTFLVVRVWNLGLREVWFCMIADNITKAVLLTVSMIIEMRGRMNSAETAASG